MPWGYCPKRYGDVIWPMGRLYDVAYIERGSYVEVMIMLLCGVIGMDDGVDEFDRDCTLSFAQMDTRSQENSLRFV